MENTLENKMRYLQAHRNEVLLPDESKFTPYAVAALFQAANMPYFTIAEYGEMTHEDYKRRELIKELHVIKRSLRQMDIVDVLAVGDVLMNHLCEKKSMSVTKGYKWPSGPKAYKNDICIEVMVGESLNHLIRIDPLGNFQISKLLDIGQSVPLPSWEFHDVLQAYQYLTQKGYALPWMGLSEAKQLEYGWVKLQDMSGCEYVI